MPQITITLTPIDNILVGKYSTTMDTVLIVLDSDSGAFTVTLPDADGSGQHQFLFKNIGANTVTVSTVNSQVIDYTGTYTHSIATKEFFSIMSDGLSRFISLESNLNRFGSEANYTEFDSNGNLTMAGTATVFEDLNFDPTRSGGPAVTLPDYVTINSVIHREFTSANNQICGDAEEIPHKVKLSSTFYPHAHVFLKSGESAGSTGVSFTIYWELRETSGTTSGSVVVSATSAELSANANKINILDSTGFAGSLALGAQLALTLKRTAGDAGDVVVTTYGIHYEIDTLGSNTITTK